MEPEKVKFKWLVSLITAVLILTTIALHFTLLIPGPDAGIFMYGGMLINKGYLPYVDLWDNKPPLIYYIASIGYLYKSNPFFAARIFEALCYLVDLYFIRLITLKIDKERSVYYLLTFSTCYLLYWEGGFLTEVFTIPLYLAMCYLYFTDKKTFLPIGTLIWWAILLLKPNAIILPTILISLHFFTNHNKVKSTVHFLLAFVATAFVIYIWLSYVGMWKGFTENVFLYNIKYATKGLFTEFLLKQITTPSHIVYLLIVLTSAYFYSQNNANGRSKTVLATFILCYIAAFMNGKNHEHYALLTILPATQIIAYTSSRYSTPFILSILLIATALYCNVKLLYKYKKDYTIKTALINTICRHTQPTETIYYAGKHGAYLYIVANKFSSSKFITPFSEQHTANSVYGKLISKEFDTNFADLLLIPKDSLNSQSHYYTTIVAQLYHYTPVDTAENIVFYKLRTKHP